MTTIIVGMDLNANLKIESWSDRFLLAKFNLQVGTGKYERCDFVETENGRVTKRD